MGVADGVRDEESPPHAENATPTANDLAAAQAALAAATADMSKPQTLNPYQLAAAQNRTFQ